MLFVDANLIHFILSDSPSARKFTEKNNNLSERCIQFVHAVYLREL